MKLLTTKEAAAQLGVSPRTLQAWRYEGKGPDYLRFSHKNVRYSQEALNQWLKDKAK